MTGRKRGRSKAGTNARGSPFPDLRAQVSREWKTALPPSLQPATARTPRPVPSPPLLGLDSRRGEGVAQGRNPARPGAYPGLGVGRRGRPEARGLRPLPAARPTGACPPLPVVAVIFERREVLLQLPVRLLEPLAQVLELAAERRLEGRVLGVHARADPALPAPSPASPPPAAPPFVLLASPLSLPSFRDRGLPAHGAGPRRRRSRWRGKWGGGAEEGGAGRAQGAAVRRGEPGLPGCGWGPPPSSGGLRRGGCRAHRPPPREKRGGGEWKFNTRSSDAQDKSMKGHPRYCSYWEKEATGDDRKKGKWGLEAD